MNEEKTEVDVDKIARDLAEDIAIECGCSMPTVASWVVTVWIRETIEQVRDAAFDEAILACNHAWTKAGNRLPNHADCIAEIKALKKESK